MTTQTENNEKKKKITIEMPDGKTVGGNGRPEAKTDGKKTEEKKGEERKAVPPPAPKADTSEVGRELELKTGEVVLDAKANARQDFDRELLAALSGSIKVIGLINPLSVYKGADGRYHLIAGERRLRSAKLAGRATVPVRVFPGDPIIIAIIRADENWHTQRLNPLEQADVIASLIGKDASALGEKPGTIITQKYLAHRWHVTEGNISQRLDLRNLPQPMQDALRQDKVKFTDARELLDIKDPKAQMEKFQAFLKGDLDRKDLARAAEKERHARRQAKGGKPLGRPAAADASDAPNIARQGLDTALERLRAIKKLEVKGAREVREGLELAYERLDRSQSDERRQYLKGVSACLEWMAGFRDEF